jgi:hypothetical protein
MLQPREAGADHRLSMLDPVLDLEAAAPRSAAPHDGLLEGRGRDAKDTRLESTQHQSILALSGVFMPRLVVSNGRSLH